jgi:hypothetical protein
MSPRELSDAQKIAIALRRHRRIEVAPDKFGSPVIGLAGHDGKRCCLSPRMVSVDFHQPSVTEDVIGFCPVRLWESPDWERFEADVWEAIGAREHGYTARFDVSAIGRLPESTYLFCEAVEAARGRFEAERIDAERLARRGA